MQSLSTYYNKTFLKLIRNIANIYRLAMEKSKLTNTIAPLISTLNDENQKFPEATSNISTVSEIKPTTRMKTMDKIINVCIPSLFKTHYFNFHLIPYVEIVR